MRKRWISLKIICDFCGRDGRYRSDAPEPAGGCRYPADQAKADGWHKNARRRDICPACWEKHRYQGNRLW